MRTLADLKCASTDDKIAWMRFYRQSKKDEPPVRAFCGDCQPDSDFRHEAIAAGTCIKVKQ